MSKAVPTIWVRSGAVDVVTVTVTQPPVADGAWLETGTYDWAMGFHQVTGCPASTPQTVNTNCVKALPGDTDTSKNTPLVAKPDTGSLG